MESIWSLTTNIPPRPALTGDVRTEAAVIGGGLAGCLTAYFLQRQGVRTVVLEAGRIGSGQTKNTTAKITSQHGLIYDRLIRKLGTERARMYAAANQHAIEKYRNVIRGNGIDCDFQELPAYLYTKTTPGALQKEWSAAARLGLPARLTTEVTLPFPAAEALRFDDQAQFHPLKFLKAISRELTVYENTPVLRVEDDFITTQRGTVTAEHIIFACHFPFINVPGWYFARMHQARSYVLALEPPPVLDGMYLGIDPDGLSFRMAGNALLLGGGSHRTGENAAGDRYDRLRRAAAAYWPGSRETACWSAQDCMPMDGVPYIGRYAKSRPNWYVATGFQKWGMTTSMVAAMLLCDLVLGKDNDYVNLFSPRRFWLGASAGSMATNVAVTVKSLGRSAFAGGKVPADKLPAGHGGIVEDKGRRTGKTGLYKDGSGGEYRVETMCPHLGCELTWNPDEKSWDCPCHGSRFDHTGALISGPAQKGISLGDTP